MPLVLNGTTGVQDNSGAFVSGTVVSSTSGTSIDFTSIPSWVKRITVMFSLVSTNSTSEYLIQIGTSSGIQNTGYAGSASYLGSGAANNTINLSSGFIIRSDDPNEISNGFATLCLLNSSNGTWCFTVINGHSNEAYTILGAGAKTLSGTLDRVRFTSVNGTDIFDAGTVNILYE
jgi:hypothetical protein